MVLILLDLCGDKSWFRIKRQDMFLDEFYNPNNRTWQYYLNLTKMYNYSLFANGIIFATETPNVPIQALDFNHPEGITFTEVGEKEGLDITVTPVNATTPVIMYASANNEVFTVEADKRNNRHSTLTAVGNGSTKLTATAGNITAEIPVVVNIPSVSRTITK